MATHLVSVPTVPGASSRRSSVTWRIGLVGLIMSVPVFLLGLLLPEPSLHPIDVFVASANRAGSAEDAARRAATRTPQAQSRRDPVVAWPAADRRSPALTMPERTTEALLDPDSTDPEVRSQSGMAAHAREAAWERGNRAESAHMETVALEPERRDVRWDLLEMAAAQHREWTERCPCPIYASDNPARGPR